MGNYVKAIWRPNNNYFANTGKKRFIILHSTAGGDSADTIAEYFKSTEGSNNPVSSHYIVGQDGAVIQCIAETNGAWAQGVVNNANWLNNPNMYCISIEHVKQSTDNSDALTPAQQDASFALIKDICQRNSIEMHEADDNSGITSHAAIDPINRARCPGVYPWDALWKYLQGGNMKPTANQQKAADDCWGSFFWSIKQQPPQTGTGIYQAWLAKYIQGVFYGPAITYEYSSKDWNGNTITVQEFAHARCEWSLGAANWYGPNGKI